MAKTWERKDPRYNAQVEIHVDDGARQLVTMTREVSLGGLFYFAEAPPEAGSEVTMTVYNSSSDGIALRGVIRYPLPGVGAGVELIDDASPSRTDYRKMVQQLGNKSAWRTIAKFLRPAEAVGKPSSDRDSPVVKELIEIGDGCEAFKILFERYPPVPVSKITTLRIDAALKTELAAMLVGVSAEPVLLKLHPRDHVRTLHIGVLKENRRFVALAPLSMDRKKYTLYALSGVEQIVIREGKRTVYPHFSPLEVERIVADTELWGVTTTVSGGRIADALVDDAMKFSANLNIAYNSSDIDSTAHETDEEDTISSATDRAPLYDRLIDSMTDWQRMDETCRSKLELLFSFAGAEERTYRIGGSVRTVKLLRGVGMDIREGGDEDDVRRATLIHDGARVCALFGLRKDETFQIRALGEQDEIRIIR